VFREKCGKFTLCPEIQVSFADFMKSLRVIVNAGRALVTSSFLVGGDADDIWIYLILPSSGSK
jgi:hypothetical protein